MTEWHYVPVPAVAKQRARLGRRRRAYTPEKTLHFEAAIKQWWEANGEHYGDQPIAVSVEIDATGFWIKIEPLDGFHRPIGIRGDIDNYAKSIFDGLNGTAWDDDKQIEWVDMRFLGDVRKPRTNGNRK